MPQEKVDWGVLRGAIGAFAICVLLSAIMLGASHFFWQQMNSEYRNHHGRFRDASRKYLSVDEEERIIAEHYPAFVELRRRGVIGKEHRLSWVETLNEAGKALPELSYRIDAQAPFVPGFPVGLGAFDINASEMQLSLGLLHEGDLVRLLDDLNRNARGLYSVASCELARDEFGSVLDPAAANLRAECLLEWYTVDLRGEQKLDL